MTSSEEFHFGTIHANGLTFGLIEAGDGPLVLAFHGFPDLPRTFRHQMRALAAAGYRVVAPYMRGYVPTDAPAEGPYQSAVLAQDALALIAELSPEPVILIGHDWGAVAAYGAAILAPERVSKLITIAVPHGGAVGRSFLTNPEQQRRSWYIFMFQMPFAEAAVAHDDFAFLERLWQDWSPGWQYPVEELEAVKATFRQPGVLAAALDYYRHTFNPANHRPALESIRRRQADRVLVPTLYIHGADDGAVGVEVTEGMAAAFPKGLRKHILPGAGHFVHREKPEEVNRLILDFVL